MKVNLGRGFGPFDFDENGRMYSLFPENLPYVEDDFDGDSEEYTVYVEAELIEAVCNAGLDFDEFLRADVEGRAEMLEDAGIDPNQFDLDFDGDVRERLEEAGFIDEYDDDEDYEEDDEEYDDSESEYEDDEYEDEDYDEEDYDDVDYDEDEDDDEEDDSDDENPPDEFFGDL